MHIYRTTLRVGTELITSVSKFASLWVAFDDAQEAIKALKKDGIVATLSNIEKLDKRHGA